MINSALKLAAKGKLVFPCIPGAKRPLTEHGFKDATTEAEQIRAWWTEHPNANVALATGEQSGVVVLDVDQDAAKGKNGELALAGLVAMHGLLPETLEVRTPRGGRHIYFAHPGGRVPCSTDQLGVGLDVRGDGGYVLVPPSQTEPGPKTVLGDYVYASRVELAPLPGWLHALMIKGTSLPRTGTAPQRTEETVPPYGGAGSDDEIRIREALPQIPASLPHDDWVRVLMALHSWDQSRGKVLGRNWSATCQEKFREPDFEAAWRSFKPDRGVGLGTLFELARRHGWRPAMAVSARGRSRPPAPPPPAPTIEVPELIVPAWPDRPRPEAFYGVLGEFVRRLDPHTESDPMAILVQSLVGFGNLIGRTAHFAVEADQHYGNLNAATVGNSSKARKGTSWGHVVRLLRAVDGHWPKPITGLSTGEGLIYCVRDAITRVDRDGAEVIVDGGVADKRLLAIESEFGRTLQCANREGNTLSAVVRQAFDTGDLRVATKSSPHVATAAHISIIGHITGVELNLLLTKSDSANGFANRFLWVAVKRSKLLPEGGNAADLDFADLVEQLQRAMAFARTVGCMRRSAGAAALWRDIYYQLSVEQPGLLGAVVSRAEAMVMRLAMLFAVTDCVLEIEAPHLLAAKAVWDYCAASARFIFGERLVNPLAERVLGMLQDAGDRGMPLAAVYEGLSGHVEKEELHGALRELVAQGLARFDKVRTGGRPVQMWYCTKGGPAGTGVPDPKQPGQRSPQEGPSLISLNSQVPEQRWEAEL